MSVVCTRVEMWKEQEHDEQEKWNLAGLQIRKQPCKRIETGVRVWPGIESSVD
jgi:hypothetical protein